MKRPILPRAVWILLLLAAGSVRGAWLEGLRWFEHDGYTRVVFDVSEPVEFRVAPALDKGYVDVILQGELSRRMPEEKTIGARGVIDARQLRATSTSLTWRLRCENVARVSHMALDESPYKVVVDFHPAGAAEPPPARRAAAGPAAAPVRPAAEESAAPARRPAAEPAAARPAAQDDAEARYSGLGAEAKRRLIVGELLMQLGDTVQASAQLELAAAAAPEHPWTAWLLAACRLAAGDEYRARRLLEPLAENGDYRERALAKLAALTPPDAGGLVPGGEAREEDLSAYLAVLRRGRPLAPGDLYARPEPARPSRGAFGLGLALGALVGAGGWGLQLLLQRGREAARQRRSILADSAVAPAADLPRAAAVAAGAGAVAAGARGEDYAEVSRRVREELEQHMRAIEEPLKSSAGTPISAKDAAGPVEEDEDLSLEGQVYRMADQRRSIVEIAEELNMGVDEVRLVLELREQAGQLGNT